VRARCAVSDRVRPGVAWMPFGGFMDASGARASVNVLTPEEPTDWGGGSGLYDAFVEVASATADAMGLLPDDSAELIRPTST
jgi:anaerobic selenocysteine-containing dehydrogenase